MKKSFFESFCLSHCDHIKVEKKQVTFVNEKCQSYLAKLLNKSVLLLNEMFMVECRCMLYYVVTVFLVKVKFRRRLQYNDDCCLLK